MNSTQRINKMEIWHLKVSESKFKEKSYFFLFMGLHKDVKVYCTTMLYNDQAHNSAGKCFSNGSFGCQYKKYTMK